MLSHSGMSSSQSSMMKNPADIQLDVVPLLLGLEEVEGCPPRHEEQCPELELTLDREVLHCQVVLPVIGEGLVEGRVFLIGDVLGLTHPQRLVLVQLLPLMGALLDLLRLLLLRLLLLLLVVLLNLLLLLVIGVSDLLLLGFFHVELDGEKSKE